MTVRRVALSELRRQKAPEFEAQTRAMMREFLQAARLRVFCFIFNSLRFFCGQEASAELGRYFSKAASLPQPHGHRLLGGFCGPDLWFHQHNSGCHFAERAGHPSGR